MKPIDQLSSRDGVRSDRAASSRAFSNRFLTGLVALSAGLVLAACGGGGGGGSPAPSGGSGSTAPTPPVVLNTVQMTMDTGPTGSDNNAINIPYVSVTVCKPGTTQCQTIDHIMVDTGSYGLRIVSSLSPALGLPAQTTAAGATVGECGQFVSGYTWGSVLKADVKIGNEVASDQSIQVVDNAAAIGAAPSACTAKGGSLGSVKALGANGVLGIGLFKQDCGQACVVSAAPAAYYACTGGSCTPTTMPLAQQVANPVAAFAVNNNGVIVSYPAVSTGGGTAPVGTLTFGIGTQSNNVLTGVSKYAVNGNGNFTTVYKGVTMGDSFLDTGSNGLFFTDSSLPKCSFNTDFYCPPTPQNLTANIISADNTVNTPINFTVESVDKLPNGAAFGWIAGPGTGSKAATTFDWGMPFFFGRKVYIGMESDTTRPYWAF